MLNSTQTDDTEAGFTLLEMTVTMSLFGMLTIMIFNLMNAGFKTQEFVTANVSNSGETTRALSAIGGDVRLSPEAHVSEDGEVLYLKTQSDNVVVWELTGNGLTNGARVFENVEQVHFEERDGLIKTTIELGDGTEESNSTGSRFEATGESTLTNGTLQARGVLRD
jgi:prepilin-type N-terminal cleavage/methylation domain-containing protein